MGHGTACCWSSTASGVYALDGRSGELRWSHASGTPTVAILASSRLDHVIVQSELETFALRPDGEVAWRAAHSDVITEAELVAGRLDLTTLLGPACRPRRARGRAEARPEAARVGGPRLTMCGPTVDILHR